MKRKRSQPSIENCFGKITLGERLSRFAAEDGFSFHVIANYSHIRSFFLSIGINLPSHPDSIKNLVRGFYLETLAKKKLQVKQLKEYNERFSVDLDEYTSLQNKRYMCVNLSTRLICNNLGLERMEGSYDAESCIYLLKKISLFDLNLDQDVISMTTDRPIAKKRVGRYSGVASQLCYVQAIHLSVKDIL